MAILSADTGALTPRTAMGMDPVLAKLLERRKTVRQEGSYTPLSLNVVRDRCNVIIDKIGDGLSLVDVTRLGGGGSKEQFILTATDEDARIHRYVVRTDPREAVTVTDRAREAELMRFVAPYLPVPKVPFVDADADFFDQPTLIMEFVDGVTKPSKSVPGVTGLGTILGEPCRSQLKPQFLEHLANLHQLAPAKNDLLHHPLPRPESTDAALWQIRFWNEVWRQDAEEPVPLLSVTREWLLLNAPVCARPTVVHGDYRSGNYLFDEETGQMTAILDWELVHIGDYHEDVAHVLTPASLVLDGIWRSSDLFERNEWLDAYQQASGLGIDEKTLHYYEILSCYKSYIATVGTAASVAKAQHSHQDILLSTLPALGPSLLSHLCNLLEAA